MKRSAKRSGKGSGKRSGKIIALMRAEPAITIPKLANRLTVTSRAVEKQIRHLKADGVIQRVGPAKGGHWEVIP